MDARTYLDTYGRDGAERLIEAVNRNRPPERGTTVGYFKQIAYGHRRPSFELAEDMAMHDPMKALDVASLMKARRTSGGAEECHG